MPQQANQFSQHLNKVKRRANRLLRDHAQHQDSYEINFMGIKLILLPDVFSPIYGEGAKLLSEFVNTHEEETVLDMGTGSGALAIFAAKKGSKVVAIDMSPAAVSCAKLNVKKLGLESKVDVRHGDLFSPLKADEQFSLIIFNPPFMDGNPTSYLQAAMFDAEYRTLTKFFRSVKAHLADNGRILLAFSNAGDVNRLESLINQYGLRSKVLKRIQWDLEFFVYEVKRK